MISNTNLFGNWWETEVGHEILVKKYLHPEEKTFEEFTKRVSSIFSGKLQEPIKQALVNADFFPAGRSLYGAGSKGKFRASLSNCYILPMPEDNIESIFDVAKKMARIFSYGGGCGINISNLRPNGAKVSNAARTSTGAVSFMNIFDSVGGVIGANNRRAALLIGLNCSHPDIEEFLEIKQNNTAIQSANISILFDDEFMEAVENRQQYELKFTVGATEEVIKKTIDAREFFMKFCTAQWNFAEPGALFIDRIRGHNILSGYPEGEYRIDITNPCFTGDMKLLTDKGYQTFEELDGKEHWIRSYDGGISVGKVWCSGEKDTVKIKFYGGKAVTCTPNHVFMTIDKQEVMAKDIKGYRVMPFVNSSSRSIEMFYEKLGFIQGDGQLTRLNSEAHLGLEINIGKNDGDILDLFEFTHADMSSDGRSIYVTGYNETLKALGFSPKILPERIFPTTYNGWILDKKSSFLRGCYSANGCVMNGKSDFRIQYKTTCKIFAEQMVEALAEFNINSYITTNKPKNVKFSNGDYVCKESYDINIAQYESKRLFYNIIGFVQSYKDELLFNLLFEHAPKVSSVKPNGVHKVYDFSEPKNHWGVVEGVIAHNCAEYCGSEWNACTLGSINLYNIVLHPFTSEATIDFQKFNSLVALGVRALDEILDYGYDNQPLAENRTAIDDWRAIGLGIFGLADMFIALGIRYGSKESIETVDKLMSTMVNTAVRTSALLAKDKGCFSKYNWDHIRNSDFIHRVTTNETYALVAKYGLRNGSLLSIAPTGSIGTMAGLSGGVEPIYQISYERTTHALEKTGKTFRVFAKSVEHLQKTTGNSSIPQYVVESHDINPQERIALQGTMQKYVDNAISSTINLKNSATVQDVYETYLAAWQQGCKGITVFRDGCARISILGKQEESKDTEVFDTVKPKKRRNVKKLHGTTFKKASSCANPMYVTINTKGKEIFEVFTNASGGCKSNISTITRLVSLALRSGIKVENVIEELKENQCPACQVLRQQGRTDISASCGTCIAEAIEEVYCELKKPQKKNTTGLLKCPSCGEEMLRPEGKCFNCSNCGYSKCD